MDMFIFEINGIGWDLSMMRISYELTKITLKTEKFENLLKTFNIKL